MLYPTDLLLRGYIHTKNEQKSCPLKVIPTYAYMLTFRDAWLDHDVVSHHTNNFSKNSNFAIFSKPQHETYLLTLVDKMCKYEMVLASIVEDTERIRFRLQTDGRTNDAQSGTIIPLRRR